MPQLTGSVSAVEAGSDAEVSCVVLPLRATQLILPAACVAEVLPWRPLAPLVDAPQWCLGTIDWHGDRLPVVDFESLDAAEDPTTDRTGRSLVVLNRTTPSAAQPFYVCILREFPRWMELAQRDVLAETDPQTAGELLRIDVGAERLVLPDLVRVEARLAELTRVLGAAAVR